MKIGYFVPLLLLCTASVLQGGSESDRKTELIDRIVRTEFNRVKNPTRPASWQIYANSGDAKIKTNIYAKIQKQIKPFETKTKLVGVPASAMREINKEMATRFPYKTPEDIARGAVIESEREYPLAAVKDKVTIRFSRNRKQETISGELQSVREDGTVFEVGDQLVRLSEMVPADRKYFNPELNQKARGKFADYFKTNYKKVVQNYRNRLISREKAKMLENEKNGYIFYRGDWRTAKYVADQRIVFHKKNTDDRLKIERANLGSRRFAAPKKKKD